MKKTLPIIFINLFVFVLNCCCQSCDTTQYFNVVNYQTINCYNESNTLESKTETIDNKIQHIYEYNANGALKSKHKYNTEGQLKETTEYVLGHKTTQTYYSIITGEPVAIETYNQFEKLIGLTTFEGRKKSEFRFD